MKHNFIHRVELVYGNDFICENCGINKTIWNDGEIDYYTKSKIFFYEEGLPTCEDIIIESIIK